ncbi:MAG: methyltransferase domain-containing protein [Pyrinomonadaceae bacterium]
MFGRFNQRSYELERLDKGEYTPAEYELWQHEMRFVHRFLGENRALYRALMPEAKRLGGRFSVLDVGAGSGGLLTVLSGWAKNQKPFLVGAELDSNAARSINQRAISALQCDALSLPFEDDSFDFVICSLFLHHLVDDTVIGLLAEMKRVARCRILAIDLHRSPIAYYFYKYVGSLFLQRFTVEDGSLSILRAFKPSELEQFALAAGLTEVSVRRSAAYRLVLSGK